VFGAADVDPFHVLGIAGAQLVEGGRVIHDVDTVEGLLDRRPVGHVALCDLDGEVFESPPVARGSDEHAHVLAPGAQGGCRPGTQEAGRSSYERRHGATLSLTWARMQMERQTPRGRSMATSDELAGGGGG